MAWLIHFDALLPFCCRCDADPAALAKYIVALIKKDKPESSLRETCTDQLDVFLQDSAYLFNISGCGIVGIIIRQIISFILLMFYFQKRKNSSQSSSKIWKLKHIFPILHLLLSGSQLQISHYQFHRLQRRHNLQQMKAIANNVSSGPNNTEIPRTNWKPRITSQKSSSEKVMQMTYQYY